MMMDMDAALEEERYRYFEASIEDAKEEYERDNNNAGALTRWGSALIEMSHVHRGQEAMTIMEEGISKLKMALDLDPQKHHSLWCLGNAYTSKAFMLENDKEGAQKLFDMAFQCFIQAKELDPENDIYSRAIEVTTKGPDIYDEIQKQVKFGQDSPVGTGGESSKIGGGGGKSKKNESVISDFWWDVAGWICLLGIGIVILSFSQQQKPPNMK